MGVLFLVVIFYFLFLTFCFLCYFAVFGGTFRVSFSCDIDWLRLLLACR